jgi:hypothetical protein
MSRETWQESVITATGDGTAVTGTTATSLLPTGAKYVLPANWSEVGRMLRVRAAGRISNIVTTPGTLTLDVRFGSAIVFDGGGMQLNAVAKTNVAWVLEADLVIRAIGSGTAANLLGVGRWASESVVGSPVPGSGGSGQLLMPASAPAVGAGYDSTATQTVDLFAKFSLTGNSITLHQFTLESLN